MRSFRFGLRRFCSRPVQKYPQYVDLVGKTPMLDLTKFARACGLPATSKTILLGKAEFFNPSFSMKDRPMKFIIEQAVADGKLKPGMTILAASSGNLGASAAMLGSIYGFDCTIITDQKCSQEKKDAITAYGAKLIVADPTQNYMEMELELATAQPEKYFSVDQYENLRNPFAHFHSTGADVFEQTSGTVTHFVAGASTGGTISGVGGYLKRENPCTKVILADPFGSVFTPMIETGEMITPGKFLVEGVGKQNIPGAMDISVIDSCIQISDAQTFQTCRDLARIEVTKFMSLKELKNVDFKSLNVFQQLPPFVS